MRTNREVRQVIVAAPGTVAVFAFDSGDILHRPVVTWGVVREPESGASAVLPFIPDGDGRQLVPADEVSPAFSHVLLPGEYR